MGAPNSQLEQDLFRQWLCKGAKPSAQQLEESGLGVVMLERLHELIMPQLRYLKSKPMEEFTRKIGNTNSEARRLEALEELGLISEKALRLRDDVRHTGPRIESRAAIYLLVDGRWVAASVKTDLQSHQGGYYECEWRIRIYPSAQTLFLGSEPSLEPCKAEPTPALDLCDALYGQLEALIDERRERLNGQEETLRKMAHVLWA